VKLRTCIKFQKFSGKKKLKSLPLKPVLSSGPFQQWGLDFIGEIHPASRYQHRLILMETYYFTKWIEAIPTRKAFHKVIIVFLEDIIVSFGCPTIIVTDNTASFKVEPLITFSKQFGITLIHSTPYYPQGNGLAESSNESLVKIIKIFLKDNKKALDSNLKFFMWAGRVTTKWSLGISPFQCVYGIEEIFPSHLALPVEKFFQDCQGESDDMIRRIQQLVEVKRTREKVVDSAHEHQQKIKHVFDKKT